MKHLNTRNNKHWASYVLITIFVILTITGSSMAKEEIGNLVFNAMKKIDDVHQNFTNKVKVIRDKRKNAVAKKESIKQKYLKARDGSLDQKEFHAEYTLQVAKIYKSLYEEAKLAKDVSGKHLRILNKLTDSISKSGNADLSAKETAGIIKASKGFLNNGRTLLRSLGRYANKITDPMIHSRLNLASDTAAMLSRFINQANGGSINKYSSRKILKQKVRELEEQFKAIYVQTDIAMNMIKDKCLVVKMINQTAASEMAGFALTGGNNAADSLSNNVILPMTETLNDSDDDLEILISGVNDSGIKPVDNKNQRWIKENF